MGPSNGHGHVASQPNSGTADSAMPYEDYDASFINMKLNEPSWMKTFEVAKQQQSQQQNRGNPALTTHLEGGGRGGRPQPRRSNSFSDSRSSFQMSMGPAWMQNFKLDKPKDGLADVSSSDDDSDDDDFDDNSSSNHCQKDNESIACHRHHRSVNH